MWGSHENVSLLLIPDGVSRRPVFAFWSNYSPQLPILEHPQSVFFPYYKKSKHVFISKPMQELKNSHHVTAWMAEESLFDSSKVELLLLPPPPLPPS
jgi:hypothetical protein